MNPAAIVARYRTAGVLVDTNLLLLYFVGAYSPEYVQKFKRTMQFTADDHALLLRFFGLFERVVTTPHILTEVSNLAGQISDPARHGVFERFAAGTALLDEQQIAAIDLARLAPFARFGLTDCAVLHQARDKHLVLTDDFRLSQYLQTEGIDVLNFNHLRMYNLFT